MDDLRRQWHDGLAQPEHTCCAPSVRQAAKRCCAKARVASVCFNCFRCFRVMLQMFRIDVAKVDRDVAYVAMAIHACCKRLFQIFHLPSASQTYVTSILCGCCICSTHMLLVFYLDVAYDCNSFQVL
jgi:hypothetical protein